MSVGTEHWYTRNGEPRHSANLVTARKENLFPSVTTVTRQGYNFGLEKWKIVQCLNQVRRMRRTGGETDYQFASRVMARAFDTGALDFGSRIHKSIENWFLINQDPEEELQPFVLPVLEFLESDAFTEHYVREAHETRVVTPTIGVGGTIDLHGWTDPWGLPFALDFKTRNSTPGSKMDVYPSETMQIAAYQWILCEAHGLLTENYDLPEDIRAVILVISSTEPGRLEFFEIDRDELSPAFVAFCGLMDYWKFVNSYDPTQ